MTTQIKMEVNGVSLKIMISTESRLLQRLGLDDSTVLEKVGIGVENPIEYELP